MPRNWRRLAGTGILLLLGLFLSAAAPVPMQITGPPENRVKVFFLGDGYTASQIDTTYVSHVQAMIKHLFNDGQDPFPRYKNFFDVYRVNVVSNQSGADVPPQNIYRDTALDAKYYGDGVTDRLLTINGTKANAALNASLAGTGLTANMKYVTVNDSRYGGSGGSWAVYAGGNSSATEIALHEVGHSFAGLADEYGGNSGTYTGIEPGQPNVTKNSTGLKWSQWLGYNQAVIGTIGAYEGGLYYDHGVYRPSSNSKMRSLFRPFDAVSREQFILHFYDIVHPIDSHLPTTSTITDPAAFWLDVIDPAVINIQWLVNGSPVPGATGEHFDIADYGYSPGTYTVTARAFDPTDWVRLDRSSLEESVTWQLTFIPEPGLAVTALFAISIVIGRRPTPLSSHPRHHR